MLTIPGLLFGIGVNLYVQGMIVLYYKMYRRYGLYELFNVLVLFKFLNQHGKEAKPYMIILVLGIMLLTVSAVWLHG